MWYLRSTHSPEDGMAYLRRTRVRAHPRYGTFLATQLNGYITESPHCLLESVGLACTRDGDSTSSDGVVGGVVGSGPGGARSRQVADTIGSVVLYEGDPGPDCGCVLLLCYVIIITRCCSALLRVRAGVIMLCNNSTGVACVFYDGAACCGE